MSWGRAYWFTVRNLWKLFIYPWNFRRHCSQCLGQFCCLWMFWIVAGLSCGQIGKVNSRLSPLLARTGEKAIVFCLFVCFLPEAWACRRWNWEASFWHPPRSLMCVIPASVSSGYASQTTLLADPGSHLCFGRHSLPKTSSESIPP